MVKEGIVNQYRMIELRQFIEKVSSGRCGIVSIATSGKLTDAVAIYKLGKNI